MGKGLLRAKLVNVLAMLAGHSKDVREELFDRLDFLMELRFALDTARDSRKGQASLSGAAAQRAEEEDRRLRHGLYESCVCLSIHAEFKEELKKSKKTLKAMQDAATGDDL